MPCGARIPFPPVGIWSWPRPHFENFDGSDLNAAGCFDCNPNDCLTKVSSVIPVVRVTVGGTTTVYYDTGQQLNTNGVDPAGCPYTGQRNDESENWEQVSTQIPANYVVQWDGAGEVILVTSPGLELWMATPYPNPGHGRLAFMFRIGNTGEVRLGVYDVTGRMVRESVDGTLGPGEYRDDVDSRGRRRLLLPAHHPGGIAAQGVHDRPVGHRTITWAHSPCATIPP
ncbi:MAG: hypothetical protein ACRENJ_00020 [Candidatus Eiseniibacteriota bacterium]